ncbi:uncharacterized protein [Primulina eburnea]|uniref:uncharacterized protein n=1 Tax=Primulina eburnea TaxID=1245227 RepID=UPI003C6C2C1E
MLDFDEASVQTNLGSFLDSTTPTVPSHFLYKSDMKKLNRVWHPLEREKVESFMLGDLWNIFDEWSAYGAGVPVTADDAKNLDQYFVPYLSAIQIFTTSSLINCLKDREETDSTSETRDSFNDSFSDESESEKLSRWDGCSSDEAPFERDNFWRPNEKLGSLYFQYFEKSSPYGRVPLMDKVSVLAQRYPGLMSLRSVDLSPASWMAVAWYPIYHIPTTGRTFKDLQACFLTYHTLSSSFQDMDFEDEVITVDKETDKGAVISLTPFGLATYKMQGDVWLSEKNAQDKEKLGTLLSAADSWLKQLGVQHHDFDYFMGLRHA